MKIKKIFISLFIFFIIPLSVLAYSSEVYLGGDNIGIIGHYEVNSSFIAESSG